MRRFRLTVEVLPKKVFDKKYGCSVQAYWNDVDTVSLREERTGLLRLSDWLHECKHVWVDKLDTDNVKEE